MALPSRAGCFQGGMGELRIYRQALTPEEISRILKMSDIRGCFVFRVYDFEFEPSQYPQMQIHLDLNPFTHLAHD
jgi:hypothetical protein